MNEINSKKGIAVTAAVLALIFAAAVTASVYILRNSEEKSVAYIYSNGELVETLRLDTLDEPVSFRVDTDDGGYNIIEAEKGRIHVSEASCPDKVCIHTGYISDGTLPVSCLPNRLIIRIEKDRSEDEPDIAVN